VEMGRGDVANRNSVEGKPGKGEEHKNGLGQDQRREKHKGEFTWARVHKQAATCNREGRVSRPTTHLIKRDLCASASLGGEI